MAITVDTGIGGNRGRGFRLVGRRLARLVFGLPALGGILACIRPEFPDQTAEDDSATLNWLSTPDGMVAVPAGWSSLATVG